MWSCSATRRFFFTAPAPTGICTLSLHDALPISTAERRAPPGTRLVMSSPRPDAGAVHGQLQRDRGQRRRRVGDRKSTRLNSSHVSISYAVFCLKKKTTESEQKPA